MFCRFQPDFLLSEPYSYPFSGGVRETVRKVPMEDEPRLYERTKRGKRPYLAVLHGQIARSKRCFDPFSDSFSRLLGEWRRVLATRGDAEPQQPELEERLEKYYAATR